MGRFLRSFASNIMGKRLTIALAAFAFVAVLLGTYVAGYFWLGKWETWPEGTCRYFPLRWMRTAYAPCGWAEAKLIQDTVDLYGGEVIDSIDCDRYEP